MDREYDSLTLEEKREILKDPTFLPTEAQVLSAFPPVTGGLNMDPEWRKFCTENYIFQLLTQELVADITTQIVTTLNNELQKRGLPSKGVTILELGAGDGRLAHFLQNELKKRELSAAVKVVASDNKSWKVAKTTFPVEELSATDAVHTYAEDANKPVMLLSSWMPLGENWTTQFLPNENVVGILLIGEKSSTGTQDETWSPEGYSVHFATDEVRGNFGRSLDTPQSSYGGSDIHIITKT